jgi:hypothetical protein
MHQQLWGYKVEEKLYVGVREQKRLNTAGLMHQQLWGYKVEEKLYVGVREQKRLNTAGLDHLNSASPLVPIQHFGLPVRDPSHL